MVHHTIGYQGVCQNPRMRRLQVVLIAMVYVCNVASSQLDPAATRGRTQFVQSCGFCHGPDASGGAEGPNLIRSALVRHDRNGNLIAPVIRDGRRTKGMPPIPLSERQIADVVAFLHWRLEQADLTSPLDPREYGLKTLFTGNTDSGKSFFFGGGGCSACHSPSGDLAGIAKKFQPSDLQARFLYPADVPKTATIVTRTGTRFTGKLFYHDQFNIAIKDDAGWYHSWRCSEVKFEIHDPVAAHLELLHRYSEADIHNLFAYLETLK
jgi:cytochrome c oxidase cbb3-type subunit III